MPKPRAPVRDCDRKRAPHVSRPAAAFLLRCFAHQSALVHPSMPQTLDSILRDAESFEEVLEAVKEELEADEAGSAETWLRYWERKAELMTNETSKPGANGRACAWAHLRLVVLHIRVSRGGPDDAQTRSALPRFPKEKKSRGATVKAPTPPKRSQRKPKQSNKTKATQAKSTKVGTKPSAVDGRKFRTKLSASDRRARGLPPAPQ